MPDAESEPRRIRTLGDVQDVLESDGNSIIELLDCVEVCRIENNVDLRHHCAELALKKALGADNVRVPRVEIASTHVLSPGITVEAVGPNWCRQRRVVHH